MKVYFEFCFSGMSETALPARGHVVATVAKDAKQPFPVYLLKIELFTIQ